ncbi:PREDICTED: uncharacterized protein LOC104607511 [Nelumbo nucifera]|uniref:Uncharacterized protein LOC104607511 n=1 Tax=Nelumbo nucifera TaxID=4432 RepID=A0A1U8ATS8_NELNU|nr:PREDICTED: uncharacterized protein LOC104607511 [Nelumbo nucifera]
MEIEEVNTSSSALPLLSLNHVSLLCRSVSNSVRFYEQVLGFVSIKRPSSFNFHGAWLFNYGVGIHLLENTSENANVPNQSRPINPKDNHISFQCTDVGIVKMKLQEMGMKYVTALVEEEGNKVDQVFFHDPDGYMIEICNCENIPVVPLSACPLRVCKTKEVTSITFPLPSPYAEYNPGDITWKSAVARCGMMERAMMMSLSKEMMNFSF